MSDLKQRRPAVRALRRWLVVPFVAAALCLLSQPAHAEPELRLQVDQHGDFVLIGNTLAHDCDDRAELPEIPAPVVGLLGQCPEISPTAPDVYFRADDPSAGQARGDASLRAAEARSSARLELPAAATVTYARLYWGAYAANSSPEGRVVFERPEAAVRESLRAERVWTRRETPSDVERYWYQAAVDVTELVAKHAAGVYRVGDIESVELASLSGDFFGYAAWYLVVFYENAAEPQRNLTLYEGLDLVEPELPTSVSLSGFLVPPRELGFDAKLGVVAFEGDANIAGDGLRLGNEPLSDAQNPVDNFFNATRSRFGQAQSVVGDLPQLSGAPRSMSGIDLDVLDITSLVRPGQALATLTATSTRDTFLLGSFVTAFSTLKPNFQRSTKTVQDLNGEPLRPNDELMYTISLVNRGSDASQRTVLRDVLPSGVRYVPESIEVLAGPSAGPKTDAPGDDTAEYDALMRSVIVRLGQGANAELGGSLAIDEDVIVRLRVLVEPSARGAIRNQAVVSASGARGALAEEFRTDGDAQSVGAQSTDLAVNACESSRDCVSPTPLCDLSLEPGACVACLTSLDCQEAARPDCSTDTHRCGCEAGADACRADTDYDGTSDVAEERIGSDPRDADSDDDGSIDGAELAPELDSDGDGLINVLDADSDNDGLFDGTEQGHGCDHSGTDLKHGRCRPDADEGVTTTHPLRRDTDRGGISDGSEDFDLNGQRDPDESDPTFAHALDDKASDADGDGLSDELERTLHSDPKDADSDDDGVPDAFEHNLSEDTDSDGLLNVRDVDSDDDALFDGTELGRACDARGTDAARGHCHADADIGQTKTCALLADTDRAGVRDGAEDANANGRLDDGETDPTARHANDDGAVADADSDGLSDAQEKHAGSEPEDADSDDDGVLDGEESNPTDDADGDGLISLLDADSDADVLSDGTERGASCEAQATDRSRDLCVPDADGGETTTSTLNADSDEGGVQDGAEDRNHNGRIDPGELDPNDATDDLIDRACATDANCGSESSGRICFEERCRSGCRGRAGNACPEDAFCSSSTSDPGTCQGAPPAKLGDAGGSELAEAGTERASEAGSQTGTTSSAASKEPHAGPGPDGRLYGGGCGCQALTSAHSDGGIAAALSALSTWLARSRRRRKHAKA